MKKTLFLFIVLLSVSCTTNELQVDVSDVKIKTPEFKRLDTDLFELNENNFEPKSSKLLESYGSVYQKYLMNPLRVAGTDDSAYKSSVLTFIGDRDIKSAHSELAKIYTEEKMAGIEEELLECFKHFKYHFPKKELPEKVVFCQTGWNYAFAYVDKSFLIGLDMYLGENSEFYKMLSYPQYQVRKMNAHYLLPDIARGWILTEFDNSEAEDNLLSHAIFYGKLFYAIKALLPNTEDSLIIGYTGKQMQYCYTYEKKLWAYFAEKNRLYDNNLELVRELTSDGPFTGSISKECPPRIAMWMGWQIVRSYMKNNKSMGLEELMQEKTANKILNKSRYRP